MTSLRLAVLELLHLVKFKQFVLEKKDKDVDYFAKVREVYVSYRLANAGTTNASVGSRY